MAKQPVVTKSLLEIQREEAQQMKQRKEQPQPQPHPITTQQNRTQNRTVLDICFLKRPLFTFSVKKSKLNLNVDCSVDIFINILALKYYCFFFKQTSLSNSVWGSVNTNTCTNWASDSSIWGDTHNSNMGFWDEAVKEATQQPPPSRKGSAQKNNKGNANHRYLLSGKQLFILCGM